MDSRRDALKIIGAIGTTCAFPFAADELYGQSAAASGAARFFTSDEMATLGVLADLIIPPTDTPGGSGAGVPRYIDMVVSGNAGHQTLFRQGLEWLDGAGAAPGKARFRDLDEAAQVALLTPLCEAADAGQLDHPGARFFAALKNMTADGYYTSRIGLVEELGYQGNRALGSFPSCHEH